MSVQSITLLELKRSNKNMWKQLSEKKNNKLLRAHNDHALKQTYRHN